MKTRALVLLTSALLVAPVALARPAPQRVDEAVANKALPAAKEIIDRFNAATNMTAKFANTTSAHAKGKVVLKAMGLEGSFETWSAKPAMQLIHIELGGMGVIRQGFDGKTAWKIVPFQGPVVLEGEELLIARLDAHYDEPLKKPELYEEVTTVGRETFEGIDCYKVSCIIRALEGMDAAKTKKARTLHEFYAVDSGLLMGKKIFVPPGDVQVTFIMADYKKFGGVLVPTRNVQKLPTGDLEIQIQEVQFDQVKPDQFALPPEIAKLIANQGG